MAGNQVIHFLVTHEQKEEITTMRKQFELNDIKIITHQNLGNAAIPSLREKFISLSAYIRKEERLQINDIIINFRDQEKKPQHIKPKESRRKE